MIINQKVLLEAAPIRNMLTTKERSHGVSYGLSEAGYDIRIKQEILFDPLNPTYGGRRFTLASAIEEFHMPTDLVGEVKDKSTWARRGLSVFNTVIEPGWTGWLTLELVYHGSGPLHIPAGAGIAQILFYRTSEHAAYNGKYQNQVDQPVDAIYEKG